MSDRPILITGAAGFIGVAGGRAPRSAKSPLSLKPLTLAVGRIQLQGIDHSASWLQTDPVP